MRLGLLTQGSLVAVCLGFVSQLAFCQSWGQQHMPDLEPTMARPFEDQVQDRGRGLYRSWQSGPGKASNYNYSPRNPNPAPVGVSASPEARWFQGYKFRATESSFSQEAGFPRFRPETMYGQSPYSWGVGGKGALAPAPVFRERDKIPPRSGRTGYKAGWESPQTGISNQRDDLGNVPSTFGYRTFDTYRVAPRFRPLP